MKHLIISLLFASIVSAGELCEVKDQDVNTPVPVALKDGEIVTTTKDGKQHKVSANEYKVVKRKQQFKVKERVVENPPIIITEIKEVEADPKRHRVSLLAGQGSKAGLYREDQPGYANVEDRIGFVFGAQYQYLTPLNLIKLPVSLGIQGQSNNTGSLLLGLEF